VTTPPGERVGHEVPTFSECVVGYRAWSVDDRDQLWPLAERRRPWTPGINTARCNCGTWGSLRFDWTVHEGRRILEASPAHPAPEPSCDCGLYAWRRPKQAWREDPAWGSLPTVIGAVACWGRMQVHADGFRAEHACVVTLAHRVDADAATLAVLERIARRHRVELVALDELEQAASRHGTPLPDSLGPAAETASEWHPDDRGDEPKPFVRAPDATPDEVVMPTTPPGLRPKTLLPPGFSGFGPGI
jgi:hypothetical protein